MTYLDPDRTGDGSLVCGYCLLPVTEESSVMIGATNVPLCHDSEYSCYELVTVYGRPLADGRRVGRFSLTKGQLLLTLDEEDTRKLVRSNLSTVGICHHTVAEGCTGHGDF